MRSEEIFKTKTVVRRIKGASVVDRETGELISEDAFERVHVCYDAERFVKVYKPDLIFGLSEIERSIVLLMISRLKYSSQNVYLDLDEIAEECKVSRRTIYRNLYELRGRNIVEKEGKLYRLNCRVASVGSRTQEEYLNAEEPV